jgi:hypothetical protein
MDENFKYRLDASSGDIEILFFKHLSDFLSLFLKVDQDYLNC